MTDPLSQNPPTHAVDEPGARVPEHDKPIDFESLDADAEKTISRWDYLASIARSPRATAEGRALMRRAKELVESGALKPHHMSKLCHIAMVNPMSVDRGPDLASQVEELERRVGVLENIIGDMRRAMPSIFSRPT